ncbi:hypothetical protein Hdeb2414_s0006g00220631 [Helianthus debilis subsp. tardiflorus]
MSCHMLMALQPINNPDNLQEYFVYIKTHTLPKLDLYLSTWGTQENGKLYLSTWGTQEKRKLYMSTWCTHEYLI